MLVSVYLFVKSYFNVTDLCAISIPKTYISDLIAFTKIPGIKIVPRTEHGLNMGHFTIMENTNRQTTELLSGIFIV